MASEGIPYAAIGKLRPSLRAIRFAHRTCGAHAILRERPTERVTSVGVVTPRGLLDLLDLHFHALVELHLDRQRQQVADVCVVDDASNVRQEIIDFPFKLYEDCPLI